MFKIYSKSCGYALRALSCLDVKDWETKFSPSHICKKAKVPEASTRKSFQLLANNGLLKGESGPRGGYRLTRHPQKIILLDLVHAIDGKDLYEHCILGFPQCDSKKPCPIHHAWKDIKKMLVRQLKKSTLEDLMKVGLKKILNARHK